MSERKEKSLIELREAIIEDAGEINNIYSVTIVMKARSTKVSISELNADSLKLRAARNIAGDLIYPT
jgi:hypothetical protein